MARSTIFTIKLQNWPDEDKDAEISAVKLLLAVRMVELVEEAWSKRDNRGDRTNLAAQDGRNRSSLPGAYRLHKRSRRAAADLDEFEPSASLLAKNGSQQLCGPTPVLNVSRHVPHQEEHDDNRSSLKQ